MAIPIETGQAGSGDDRYDPPGKPDSADRFLLAATTRPGDIADVNARYTVAAGLQAARPSPAPGPADLRRRARLSMLTPSILLFGFVGALGHEAAIARQNCQRYP